ncbi:glycosyltransferase family 2 protein [Agarivorans aestuarii]|uniref:glycosyltransferase family 2 protein n=1 Tax=Agarivorans aestuarii TaxID=1563703 RepID=UPI001C7EE219|nr:glycosyltransferase family A protein [Agarivorans aestuarii]
MVNPLVSIVVPVYNGEDYIDNTVDSLLKQTYKNIEIILVNDGSKDSSKLIIEQLAQQFLNVRSFSKANGGVADARNHGISHAKGELVAFCDQDDLWEQDKLELQVPLFSKNEIGVVYSRAFVDLRQYNKKSPSLANFSGNVAPFLIQENFIVCCTGIVRKALLEEVGFFDADFNLMGVDDWHLWLKLSLICEFACVDRPLATHIIDQDNYSLNDRKMYAAEKVCIEKIRKNYCQGFSFVDFGNVEAKIHCRYAKNFVYSGEFTLAAEAYSLANKLAPSPQLKLKSLTFSLMPSFILYTLQKIKRSINF